MDVEPCPTCQMINWQFDAAGVHCLNCGHIREKLAPAQRKAMIIQQQRGLAALMEANRQRAIVAWLPDDALNEAWLVQVAAAADRATTVASVLAGNMARMEGKSPDDPLWSRVWKQKALCQYVYETWLMIEKRRHVLFCLNHGALGIETSDPEGASMRGLLTEEGMTGWLRYCEQCAAPQIEAEASRMAAQWAREPVVVGR